MAGCGKVKSAGMSAPTNISLGLPAGHVQQSVSKLAKALRASNAGFGCCHRSALAPDAPAALSAAGAALAVAFLRTGLAMEDAAMLGHLMRLLCRPLADWDVVQPVCKQLGLPLANC